MSSTVASIAHREGPESVVQTPFLRELRLAPPPRSLTALVGRERELAQTIELLRRPTVRLVSLIGPGGVGKTRLAIEAARGLQGSFADGIGFVSFASVGNPGLVLPTIAQAVDLRETGGLPLADALVGHLAHRGLLLICDNFESVVDAASDLAQLLSASPSLRVLATSQAALRISGERVVPVAPLELPNEGRLADPEAIAQSAAVRLFVERAQAVRPDFVLAADNARAVAAICRELDGLPLALELAAARTRILSPQSMVTRLTNRLGLLTAGPRDLPARHQTMRTAIAWSYDLLTADEQALFRHLAVFAGSFTIEAAESVAGSSDSPFDTLETISSLIDKSLVHGFDSEEGGLDASVPRFAMLETIRDFGLEQMTQCGEEPAARRRHAAWMLGFAELAQPNLEGPDRRLWLARLEANHNNLRAALTWTLANEPAETALRLVAAIWRFWELHGYATEGREWAERALAREGTAPDTLRAAVIYGASFLAYRQGDYAHSTTLVEEAIAIWRRLDDPAGLATALSALGLDVQSLGDHARAVAIHEEALALRRAEGNPDAVATSLNNLALAVCEQGDLDRAWALHEEQLALERAMGDPAEIAYALFGLASVAHRRGDLEQAASLHEEALALRRQVDGRGAAIAWSLCSLGSVVADLGDAPRAAALYRESLDLRAAHGERAGMADALAGLAGIAVATGDPELGVRLLGAADALRDATGAALAPAERDRRERTLTVAARVLGDEAVGAALVTGRGMTLRDLLDTAGQVTPRPRSTPPPPAVNQVHPEQPSLLSPRELDVLRLIAEGCSNREIADALSISHRTVMVHVTNILGKLGVPSRAAAAAYAHQHGLLTR